MKDPILITGCARSGTSVIAGIVNLCGAFGGDISNPRMYENIRIKNEVIIPYLKLLGVDELGQYPLPDIQKLERFNDLKDKVKQIIIEQGYKKGNWMVKDSIMGLIWAIWNEAFPNAKWVIVRRRTGDIINSCVKTGFMKAFKDIKKQECIGVSNEQEGWLWWIHQHEKRFTEMISSGLNCKVIWPERLVNGDYEQMKETIDWLRLKWNPESVNFVDTKLWRSKQKGDK